ncbi:helix-turn-helix domain-containing protein [Paenibacillus eucommiae]|uniref:AraC-like DNA-binding protein n=1 Tax=Paenibacillus eucommiae TaxID=1355755 RepID=A0ABS4IRZ5_9BACL|nr:AraC family transcriptional regulator [Paenibacillus eucommiae]MBP1989354.1 AraC-like DNA-binding protein [Paenibacillus eucommiae]
MLFHQFLPQPQWSEHIDSILVQEDFSTINFANRNPVKVLPSTLAVIGIQYGNPMKVVTNSREDLLSTSGITGLQTTYKTYKSTASIGTILIRFKPGGLTSFTPYPIHEFRDANVDLKLIFPAHFVSEMEHQLHEAVNMSERLTIVHKFLLSVYRHHKADEMIRQMSRQIQQQSGPISIGQLAGQFFASKRTVERRFKDFIGISPKKFANIVRFQQAIQLRKAGTNYLDIVHACNFSDHAHFAHDFKTFTGCSPERFFGSEVQPELARHFNDNHTKPLIQHTMYH